MKKDIKVTFRMNSEIKEHLESKGHSLQKLFDEALSRLVTIENSIIDVKEPNNDTK